MKYIVIVLVVYIFPVYAQMSEFDIFPGNYQQRSDAMLKILDVKQLQIDEVDGIEFTEISALAYDKHEGLFALSDRGRLFRFELEIRDRKIQKLRPLGGYYLKNKEGKKLKKKKRDSEGMVFTQGGLLISFELKPKASLFDLEGLKLSNYQLPPQLKDINNYRSKNKALEAVAYHREFGLITAPESPLKHRDESYHTLYSLSKEWSFPAKGQITALEVLEDNHILVLERKFSLLSGHRISLRKVDIGNCRTKVCPVEPLLLLDSQQGWNIDNFEGLTHVRENLFLMISDDNTNPFQRCLLVLFELTL